MNFKLSPSDLTFLYDGCKRCFYMKVVHNIAQPTIPLPAIFSQITGLLKNHYDGKRTNELHAELPPGAVILGEKWVKSAPIATPKHSSTCYINGRFDIVVKFDDSTYGVIDFKTGNPDSKSTELYRRQLQAYAYALEHPAPGALKLSPITRLGLLYFYPSCTKQDCTEKLLYQADIEWHEIKKDERAFLGFVDEVMRVLESAEAPEQCETCQWCSYLEKLR